MKLKVIKEETNYRGEHKEPQVELTLNIEDVIEISPVYRGVYITTKNYRHYYDNSEYIHYKIIFE